jgi:hypothetical protein
MRPDDSGRGKPGGSRHMCWVWLLQVAARGYSLGTKAIALVGLPLWSTTLIGNAR